MDDSGGVRRRITLHGRRRGRPTRAARRRGRRGRAARRRRTDGRPGTAMLVTAATRRQQGSRQDESGAEGAQAHGRLSSSLSGVPGGRNHQVHSRVLDGPPGARGNRDGFRPRRAGRPRTGRVARQMRLVALSSALLRIATAPPPWLAAGRARAAGRFPHGRPEPAGNQRLSPCAGAPISFCASGCAACAGWAESTDRAEFARPGGAA
jgi:hypothetical protein